MNDFADIDMQKGTRPLVATAIHAGHALRDEVLARSALSDGERLREEDPFTGQWTVIADYRVVARRSRFEVDLNRPRERAVYRQPADAWGLRLWNAPLPQALIEASLAEYDGFYERMGQELDRLLRQYDRLIVFDLHTYNHRRQGPDGPEADPAGNPDINLGTGTMDRAFWSPVVERFLDDVRGARCLGRELDARENIKFRGGYFSQWIHERFPGTVCCLPIEVKKFFMDEWTGTADQRHLDDIGKVLRHAIPGVLEVLRRME